MRGLATASGVVLGTAFVEGAAVLAVEIAGARTLAPFYGASLIVWTSQITATLLALAAGYLAGGRLSCRSPRWQLPTLFGVAGLWLCLVPVMRDAVLTVTRKSAVKQVALGSFISACVLFGVPLACLGAVSPVLIEHRNRVRPGAGRVAGTVFCVNTGGGLLGAWMTALVLIPNVSVRLSITAWGVALLGVALAWNVLMAGRSPAMPVAVALVAAALMAAAPAPVRVVNIGDMSATVVASEHGGVGLIQVLDVPVLRARTLTIDGVPQAGIDTASGACQFPFTEYLNVLGHGYHPGAKTALILGLGSGCVARELRARGVDVTAIEIDPRIIAAARRWFGLPADVTVIEGDARHALARLHGRFDLVLSDVFVGESAPWYLFTREGLAAIKHVVAPGGRFIVNYVTTTDGSAGLQRVEATVLDVFGEAVVHVEPQSMAAGGVVDATVVAGQKLVWIADHAPTPMNDGLRPVMDTMKASVRPARPGTDVSRDDRSDLDFADAGVRLRWRALVAGTLDARLVAD